MLQEDSLAIANVETGTGILFSNNLWSKSPGAHASGDGDQVTTNVLLLRQGPTGPGQLTPDYFRIQQGSSACDHGVVLSYVSEDFFKQPRGTQPDIGGHELVPAVVDTVPPMAPTGLVVH